MHQERNNRSAEADPTQTLRGKVGSRQDYLGRYGEIDICLDTWPFNGITTTCLAIQV